MYTDPKLLDVHKALDTLPQLPIGADQGLDRTESSTERHQQLAPMLAPNPEDSCIDMRTRGNLHKVERDGNEREIGAENDNEDNRSDVSADARKDTSPTIIFAAGLGQKRETGFEPATSSLGS